uniref:104 kDa microneme/rhoptry antigen-like n=1 Tax=Doryrhamphus excisus TaxID=161450 RepID=UPI0025ADB875|nr:104 kDa microneme/rhoptry antigen-like [Doryrhamphus excisus]
MFALWTSAKMSLRCLTLFLLFALVTVCLAAPLPDRSAVLLAHLDGKAAAQHVTSPPAPESHDTSHSPDFDDSQEETEAKPNVQDNNQAELEGAPDPTDSVPEYVESPESVASPESLESPESAESPVSLNSPESVDSSESLESPESVESPKSVESPESEESPESVESPKSADSPESEESPEFVKTSESPESLESAESPESSESLESQDSAESLKAIDSRIIPESSESLELPKSLVLPSESSSEADEDNRETSNESEPETDATTSDMADNGDASDMLDLEEGGEVGLEVVDEDEIQVEEGRAIPELDLSEEPQLIQGASDVIIEGEENSPKDGNADSSRGTMDQEENMEEQNVQEPEESFDSTEATLIEQADPTPPLPAQMK